MSEDKVKGLVEKGLMEPYIRYIRFPKYKNLEPGTKISFDYPITAIIGANGSSKSSVIKALFGCPNGSNVGVYWFSTSADPISEGDGLRNCFVYGYYNKYRNAVNEVLKVRISKQDNPDYWEPSRRLQSTGMPDFPEDTLEGEEKIKLKTRWQGVTKNVVLIDFRSALSAFDKSFYFRKFKKSKTIRSRQDFIRQRSPHLVRALEQGTGSYKYRKVERIPNGVNRTLPDCYVEKISKILGKKYKSIKLIEHTFYDVLGETAQITESDIKYTEAFAGSGEFSVISLVCKMLDADDYSLILLDEPEVSIHPGAQESLLDFIKETVLRKKHQVVFTTHSPAMIRGLPKEAIKVLGFKDGEVSISHQEAHAEEAFLKIGEPVPGKLTIFVEDRLARELVMKSMRDFRPSSIELIDVKYVPGGSKTLIKSYMVPYSVEKRKSIIFFLDGDQYACEWPNSQEIRRLDDCEVSAKITELVGFEVKFETDGGEEKVRQKAVMERNFLNWCYDRVHYLPSGNPEAFILEKLKKSESGIPHKKYFEEECRNELGLLDSEVVSSDSIFETQRRLLNKIKSNDEDLNQVAKIVYSKIHDDNSGSEV